MRKDFNSNNTGSTLAISQLRNMAETRLQAAERRMNPVALAAFNKSAQGGTEENLIGSLLFSMMTWAPFMHALHSSFGQAFGHSNVMDTLCSPLAEAVMEGVSMVRDEKAFKNRNRKDGMYHGGRRQDDIVSPFNKKIGKSFNFVSANENNRYSMDARAEIAGMNEILDMLDGLEKNGVSMIRFDDDMAATQTLKAASKPSANKLVQARFANAMRMSA